jgi:hypothetical protein
MCTYATFSRKPFRIRTYKKHPGWGYSSLPCEDQNEIKNR